ncbi:hypothetical protein Aperf_G00000055385 [Anoplocephala perfoliata]
MSNVPRFISEKDIAERKAREAAEGKIEEPYDPRSLYDRLQAERARQQEEYESKNAFKNQIHRLDDDEVAFLAEKDRERCLQQELVDEEAQKLIQEAKALNRSVLLKASAPPALASKPHVNGPVLSTSYSSLNQKALLAGIKRKLPSPPCQNEAKKPHFEPSNSSADAIRQSPVQTQMAESFDGEVPEKAAATGPACVLTGFLPGLVAYEGSSDSDDNSDSSTDVEDAALTMSPIITAHIKRGRETEGCE